MESYGSIDPSFERLIPRGIKGTRVKHKITNTQQTATPNSDLYVDIPKLNANTIIVPGTFCVTFDLKVSGDPGNTIVDNLANTIFKQIKFDIGDVTVFNIDRSDVFFTFRDLFLSPTKRSNMIYEGIQDDKLRKLRISPQTTPAETNADAVAMNKIFGTRYRYFINTDFFKQPIYPYLIKQRMFLTLHLNDVGNVIVTAKPDKWGYNLENIKVEFETITNDKLGNEMEMLYATGYGYHGMDIHKYQEEVIKEADTSFNIRITVPRASLSGILMLFKESRTAGQYISERFDNPKIKSAKITIKGVSNSIFNESVSMIDQYDEICRIFNAEDAFNTIDKFYNKNRYGFFIDTRSHKDNQLHGSGIKTDDVYLEFQKENTGSQDLTVFTFVLSHSQVDVENNLVSNLQI